MPLQMCLEYSFVLLQVASLASLASATFVCTLGREQQYFLNAEGANMGPTIPMYRQGLPATISYPPRSRLPHGIGVGSPPSLSFFPRFPSSSLPHGLGVGSLPSLSFFPRLPGSSLPHGLSVGSPLSLSFFPRLPGSSLPHGVGVGSPPSLSLLWRFPRKSS